MSIAGKSTSPRHGFTLFELVIVMAILAIGIGLLIPNLDIGSTESGIKATAKRVQETLNQGRALARLTRSEVTVRFTQTAIAIPAEDEQTDFPSGAAYESIRTPENDLSPTDDLVIDKRGIIPISIITMDVDDQVYSLLIRPVIREVVYKKGIADFEDFTN